MQNTDFTNSDENTKNTQLQKNKIEILLTK